MVVAGQLAGMAERIPGALPIGIRSWDGSVAGPQDGTVLVIRSRDALRRLVWSPNELGLARAYVSGELDIEGDLAIGLSQIWGLVRRGGTRRHRISEVVKLALQLKVLGPVPAAPKEEARLSGALHTKRRDRDAISHHHDLSNACYQLVLDPSMAYSCAYFTSDEDSLEQAQHNKLEHAVGVTISAQQREHVGESNYPTYASTLHRLLKPEGRLLLQQMSRGANAPGGGAFIESYVAPDMHMRPVSSTTGFLEAAGLEIRDVHSLREHGRSGMPRVRRELVAR